MTNNKLKAKYHLLVLLDLSKEPETTLRSAINLAEVISGSIEIYYIKPAVEVVKSANQLSAISAIDKERYRIKNKIKKLIGLVAQESKVSIEFDFAFGNVNSEIQIQLKKSNPDIVVLGKRDVKPFNFLGNDVTQFLLNNYFGNIFIAGEDKMLRTNKDISIGFYNDGLDNQSIDITKKLSRQTKKPVKFFRVRKNLESKTLDTKLQSSKFENTIEYVFEQGSNALDGLVNYVSKNDIDLLCMGRGSKTNDENSGFIHGTSEVQKVIQKLKIPLFIMQDKVRV